MSGATVGLPTPQEHRGLLAIRYPMEHGVVRDWNDMERIWQYVYSKDQLQTFSEEVGQWPLPPGGPVLPAVSSPCPRRPSQASSFPLALSGPAASVLRGPGSTQSVAAEQNFPGSAGSLEE